jgi:CRISPR-associated protein Cas2
VTGMYVVLVYDVDETRVNKVRKVLLPFLFWIQNSVFIGEISSAKFRILTLRLNKVIDKDYDTIDIFIVKHEKLTKRRTLGRKKDLDSVII